MGARVHPVVTATALQAGMVFHAVTRPGTGVDIEQISIEIDEPLDVARLEQAWNLVIGRHPILRARFSWHDSDEPTLRYSDDSPVSLAVEDWSSLDPAERQHRIEQRLRTDRLHDFALDTGPLHRFAVIELGPERWWILWTFHHAILDGRSFPLVLREVFELYDSRLKDTGSIRPNFDSYVEFIGSQNWDPARRYWTEKLASFETASSIAPTIEHRDDATSEPPRPSVAPVESELGVERTAALREVAARYDVSLNTCVQAAWHLLLGHHSQQPTVTFGTTRACRHAVPGSADMIGLLINTVPMTMEVDRSESVAQLLARIRREQVDLRRHEITPLPVIRECAPGRPADLFESIVVYDDASLNTRMQAAMPHAADTRRFRYDGQTNFPLTLLAYGDDSMLLRLEYAIDRYDEATAHRLLHQLGSLLDGFAADPNQPAWSVPYLTDAEIDRFEGWNRTDVDYELETTLQELFERQVAATPDAPALVDGGRTLTYRQFNKAANRLAHHLHRLGVTADSRVGIFAERSLEMMVGVYATLKAGGAYVPFDPEHPADRIRFMADDSDVAVMLTQHRLLDQLPGGSYTAVDLDAPDQWAAEPATDPPPVTDAGSPADHIAYLLYTSGSTGKPKGAMIEHRAIVNRLIWMQDAFGLDPSDAVLQKTPTTFDVSVWELFWPLQVGARLVLAEPGGHRDTAYLARVINEHRITTLHFVPSMLQLFVEEPTAGSCTSIRRVICSGEALPRALQDRTLDTLDTELHNLYGPTEAAIDVTWWPCDPSSPLATVPIGYPIANTQVHVLDPLLQRVPVGVQGELHLGGVQLARGYHNRPELTAEKFVPDPFSSDPAARLYKTGDLVRHLDDGAVEFLGRLDHQVKIRGQRIELGEIEAVIADHPAVREATVLAVGTNPTDMSLAAYVVARDGVDDTDSERPLREHCAASLASYMVPTDWVFLDKLPLNANGKVDRKALPAPERTSPDRDVVAPGSATESEIAAIWQELVSHGNIGVTDTFFDVGGNSLLLIRLANRLTAAFGRPVAVKELLRHTTIRQQAELVHEDQAASDRAVATGAQHAARRIATRERPGPDQNTAGSTGDNTIVAVVGMAGRFPESPDVAAFWDNLREGRDCLHSFTDAELEELGIPAGIHQRDNFVRRGTILPHRDEFDARFFGYTPKQAKIMDPQARIFLETSYEALESAGYNPFDTGHVVSVFAGSNPNDYALLLGVADPTDSLSAFDQMIGTDRDFVATRVSHSLDLTGPAMTLQTACSTSLVTIHAAVQSLLADECSMALAGGVSVNLRQGIGYFYQQGMILSPEGDCRAFDARAQGTTLGQGCGVVVLKRLADAVDDRDNILALVRATATNNDGGNKISYTAPSEDGQVSVITAAHRLAGVESDSIGYIEAHGTGTLLGDPIEIGALTRAFAPGTDRKQYCAVGSAKTNFGHTDAAAGVTGFMKTVLSLANKEIPPSINFSEPNPEIDFAGSPFYVSDRLHPWPDGPTPRRAGVSAFGIGGTNAHAVLEEARPARPSAPPTRPQVLVASGRSGAAADRRLSDLAQSVDNDDHALADVVFTLHRGRPHLDHRRAVVVGPDEPIAPTVRGEAAAKVVKGTAGTDPASLIWLFAGQGAQYPSMGADLYRREPVFTEAADRVGELVADLSGFDLRPLVFGEASDAAAEHLMQTATTQPALFLVEHALAALLRSWGLVPDAVIGHSIGEYAAAVEAGVLDWESAARLVVERGRLMQSMEPGSMLAVPLPAAQLLPRLDEPVELGAENSSELSVASGPTPAIEALAATLEADGLKAQVLHTSHAFHSEMMTAAAEEFSRVVATVDLHPPATPMISNVTGELLTAEEATDPAFWGNQIRRPVRFAQCLAAAGASAKNTAFVELGPGRALSTFVSAHAALEGPSTPTMRHPQQDRDDQLVALEAVARLWTVGVEIDWEKVNGPFTGRRVPLPTYPFEREEAWLPAHRHVLALPSFGEPSADAAAPTTRRSIEEWLYVPSWRRTPGGDPEPHNGATLVLAPATDGGSALVAHLAADGDVIEVRPGAGEERSGPRFTVDPSDPEQLAGVFAALAEEEITVGRIVHAWLADPIADQQVESLDELDRALALGVHAVLDCARGAGIVSDNDDTIAVDVVSAGAYSVTGAEAIRPEAAALAGPVKVVPLEYTRLRTRHVDLPTGLSADDDRRAVLRELSMGAPDGAKDAIVALRNGQRWVPAVAVRPTGEDGPAARLREGGRYLIVGGLGGVGLSIARHLAAECQASLVLTSRRGRPTVDDDADDETRRRVELLDEIEALAAGLEVAAVDAGDEAAMAALLDRIEAEGGPVNGVIVAAGVPDQMGAIHRRSRDDMTASIASKVHGSLILERVLADRELDFVMLSSSIASVLYHNRFAQVGYVTGNTFAEAFALRGRQRGRTTCTVAWDDWLDIGMSVRAAQDFSAEFNTSVDLVDQLHSFSPDDGVRLFERALRTDEPVLMVSTTDLSRRIEADVDVISPFLQQATGDDDGADVAGGGTVEELITSVWASLLGFESFEPSDDFFDLGGDSLQAARMADRFSRALGADVAVDLIFENARFSELVAVLDPLAGSASGASAAASTETDRAPTSDDPITGPARLSPGQLRFLDRCSDSPDHFNTSVLLQPAQPVTEDVLRREILALAARHDALRLRLLPERDGERSQVVVPMAELVDPLTVIDLSAPAGSDDGGAGVISAVAAASEEIQRSLDLENGPVFRAALFLLPDGDQRILLVTHHLMCDRVSLLLMIDGLDAGLQSGEDAQSVNPVASTTSVLRWVDALHRAADRPEGVLGLIAEPGWARVRPLPLDHHAPPEANRNNTAGVVRTRIPADDLSAAALGTAAGGRPDEQILLGLGRAFAEWSGTDTALVDVLGHGRRLPLDVDVSRSVGMFLSYSPTLIGIDDDALDRLRVAADHGWLLDVVRCYGADDVRRQVEALPRAQVLYNFVGRAIASEPGALLTAVDEDHGAESDGDGRRDHLLAVRAEQLDDGSFELTFVHSTAFHQRPTIEALAESVRARLLG